MASTRFPLIVTLTLISAYSPRLVHYSGLRTNLHSNTPFVNHFMYKLHWSLPCWGITYTPSLLVWIETKAVHKYGPMPAQVVKYSIFKAYIPFANLTLFPVRCLYFLLYVLCIVTIFNSTWNNFRFLTIDLGSLNIKFYVLAVWGFVFYFTVPKATGATEGEIQSSSLTLLTALHSSCYRQRPYRSLDVEPKEQVFILVLMGGGLVLNLRLIY